jgi:hypothetical protein
MTPLMCIHYSHGSLIHCLIISLITKMSTYTKTVRTSELEFYRKAEITNIRWEIEDLYEGEQFADKTLSVECGVLDFIATHLFR